MKVTIPKWIKWSGPEQVAAERSRCWMSVEVYILVVWAVRRVLLNWKFVAGSSLERWWAQVVQEVPKSIEIWQPGAAFGSTLRSRGAAGTTLDDLRDGFGFNLGSACSVFHNFVGKVRFVYFDSALERNRYYGRSGPQVGATWAEKLSPIGPEWPRIGKSEGSGQSSLVGRFGLAVEAMEITGNHPRTKSRQRPKSI